MNGYAEHAGRLLEKIRKDRPVVHNITNFVVMNSSANALLAMGASPIMAHAAEEVEEVLKIAHALVVNIGTLSRPWIDSMKIAAKIAAAAEKPWVLDPVGVGATRLRTETALDIISEARPTAIRGNASEICALFGEDARTRGVDSGSSVDAAADAARGLASQYGTVVAVTGERDLVTDGRRRLIVRGGDPLLTYVTGGGCALSAITAAFLAVSEDALVGSAAAAAFFGLAAEKAKESVSAPGNFWIAVIDALYTLTPEDLASAARIEDA